MYNIQSEHSYVILSSIIQLVNYMFRPLYLAIIRLYLAYRGLYYITYKTLVRPVVSYGAEAWTLTKKEEKALIIFERKIFRRIYGPKYENGEWKSRMNRELEEMSKGENIVKMDKRAKDKLVRSTGENGGG